MNRKRVARLMRTEGIAGYRRRRRVRTTAVDQASTRFPDLLERDVTAPAPRPQDASAILPTCPWPTGRTCTWPPSSTAHGRRLVGWALRDHMRTPLVIEAPAAGRSHTRGT